VNRGGGGPIRRGQVEGEGGWVPGPVPGGACGGGGPTAGSDVALAEVVAIVRREQGRVSE
jgi:hypothetical protein